MSAVRSSVEWLFGDVINYFKSLDFKKNLKIGLSSVGKMYKSDEVTGELSWLISSSSQTRPRIVVLLVTSVQGWSKDKYKDSYYAHPITIIFI